MARRRVTVEVDERLLDGARAAAERLGIPEEELFERGLRHVLALDFDELAKRVAAHQARLGISFTDDEAMDLAVREVRAYRAEQRRQS